MHESLQVQDLMSLWSHDNVQVKYTSTCSDLCMHACRTLMATAGCVNSVDMHNYIIYMQHAVDKKIMYIIGRYMRA